MARPRMKGPVIGLRLPLALDALVRERARREGVSAGIYLGRLVVRAVVSEAVRRESN